MPKISQLHVWSLVRALWWHHSQSMYDRGMTRQEATVWDGTSVALYNNATS